MKSKLILNCVVSHDNLSYRTQTVQSFADTFSCDSLSTPLVQLFRLKRAQLSHHDPRSSRIAHDQATEEERTSRLCEPF